MRQHRIRIVLSGNGRAKVVRGFRGIKEIVYTRVIRDAHHGSVTRRHESCAIVF